MKSNFGAPKMPTTAQLAKMTRGQRFDLLTPHEMTLILAIAQRASDTAKQWRIGNTADTMLEANPTILQVDLATAHLTRGLNLNQLLNAPLFDFWDDLVTLQKNNNRGLHLFPDHVALRCALKKV